MKAFAKKHLFGILVIAGVIFGITMLVLVGMVGTGAAITTPMQTWGYAQFINEEGHGEPIPVGTEVKVYIGSDTTPSGSTNTTTPGFYGSIMIIGDTTRYGEELYYTLDGYPTVKIGPDEGAFGLENQVVGLYASKYEQLPNITPTHTWTFYGYDFVPKHLPDWFIGTVNLSLIDNMPQEIQGVYLWDNGWLFWCQGAPGCTLDVLEGGTIADYMVSSAGACEWEIPLQ